MQNPFSCCKGCTERYPGCHDRCSKYQEAKAINEKRKHEENLRKQASMHIYENVAKIYDDQAKRRKERAGYHRFSKGSG